MEDDNLSWILNFDLSKSIKEDNHRVTSSLINMYWSWYKNILQQVFSWIDYFKNPYIVFDKKEDHTKWFLIWSLRNWLPASEKSLEVYFYPEDKTILLNRIFQQSHKRWSGILTNLLYNLYSIWNECWYSSIESTTNTEKKRNFSFLAQSKLWYLLDEKYFDRTKKYVNNKYSLIRPWIDKFCPEIDIHEIDSLIYNEMYSSVSPKIFWKIADLTQEINIDEEFIRYVFDINFSKKWFHSLRRYERDFWLKTMILENELMHDEHCIEKQLTLGDLFLYNVRVSGSYDLIDHDVRERMENRFMKKWLITPTSTSSPSSISQV